MQKMSLVIRLLTYFLVCSTQQHLLSGRGFEVSGKKEVVNDISRTKHKLDKFYRQGSEIGRGLKQAIDFANYYSEYEFEALIGNDDRMVVENTELFPYTAIVQITYTCPSFQDRSVCSGTLVGPHTVLTAAHCIYEVKSASMCSDFVVTPGKQGLKEPYGSARVINTSVPNDFRAGYSNPNYTYSDYGLLILDQDIGLATGWMGVAVDCDQTQYDNFVMAGFPGDIQNGYDGTTMVASTCSLQLNACQNNVSDGVFQHTCDTFGGQSGSGMWVVGEGGVREIRGVHSSGTSNVDQNPFNKGVYISVDAFLWIQANMG